MEAVDTLALSTGPDARGAVFTKISVVEAILDLCGYTSDRPLHTLRFLEPSFGDGDFLLSAVRRLVAAYRRSFPEGDFDDGCLVRAIRGVEVHEATFERTVERAHDLLVEMGATPGAAARLCSAWLTQDDFLLTDIEGTFDFVVGNPPYVRQERIAPALVKSYKARYATFYDRADLYVLFYERGLDLLTGGGVLGYICANRWLKNRYGGPLREKVARSFHLKFFVDLERADAFHSSVIAYPAITVLGRGPSDDSYVALQSRHSAGGLGSVVHELRAAAAGGDLRGEGVEVLRGVARGRAPWLLDAPEILSLMRDLEGRLPTLEASGAKVGIGVATGADRVFIGDYDQLPVERERKLKLAMASDCVGAEVEWGGLGVVNPYLESGALAAVEEFPKFRRYLEAHGEVLRRRHTARAQPAKWYRTIDRIRPALGRQPKLLIPDIKGGATVAFDAGECYPHHNVYVVTSSRWELRALQAVLRSSVALMFVAAYCVRMGGGFLRFQAQYLRRIRTPRLSDLLASDLAALRDVAGSKEQAEIDAVVLPLYGLRGEAAQAVRAFAEAARIPRRR